MRVNRPLRMRRSVLPRGTTPLGGCVYPVDVEMTAWRMLGAEPVAVAVDLMDRLQSARQEGET